MGHVLLPIFFSSIFLNQLGTLQTLEWEYVDGTSDLYKTASKIIRFKITIPDGYIDSPSFEVINTEYDNNKHIEFCYMTVVGAGNNVPCVSPNKPYSSTLWQSYKEHNG